MAARVLLREITSDEGNRLLRIVRRTSGSVVTWRRAQIVLLSAQGMSPPAISEVVFTDPDTVRNVIHNFNRDGFDALYPRYRGGRPQTFTLPKRQEIKRIALSEARPTSYNKALALQAKAEAWERAADAFPNHKGRELWLARGKELRAGAETVSRQPHQGERRFKADELSPEEAAKYALKRKPAA